MGLCFVEVRFLSVEKGCHRLHGDGTPGASCAYDSNCFDIITVNCFPLINFLGANSHDLNTWFAGWSSFAVKKSLFDEGW